MPPLTAASFAEWQAASRTEVQKLVEQLCAGDLEQARELILATQRLAREKGQTGFVSWLQVTHKQPDQQTCCDYMLHLATTACFASWSESVRKNAVNRARRILDGDEAEAEDCASEAISAAFARPAEYFTERARNNSDFAGKSVSPCQCFCAFVLRVATREANKERWRRGRARMLEDHDESTDDPKRHSGRRGIERRPLGWDAFWERLRAMLEERVRWDRETLQDGIGRFGVFERLRVRRNQPSDVAAEKGITAERVEWLQRSAEGILERWHTVQVATAASPTDFKFLVAQLERQCWFEDEAIAHGVGMFQLFWWRYVDGKTLEQTAAAAKLTMSIIDRRLGTAKSTRRRDRRTVAQEIGRQCFYEGLDLGFLNAGMPW